MYGHTRRLFFQKALPSGTAKDFHGTKPNRTNRFEQEFSMLIIMFYTTVTLKTVISSNRLQSPTWSRNCLCEQVILTSCAGLLGLGWGNLVSSLHRKHSSRCLKTRLDIDNKTLQMTTQVRSHSFTFHTCWECEAVPGCWCCCLDVVWSLESRRGLQGPAWSQGNLNKAGILLLLEAAPSTPCSPLAEVQNKQQVTLTLKCFSQ